MNVGLGWDAGLRPRLGATALVLASIACDRGDGVAKPAEEGSPASTASHAAEVRARAGVRFARADFLKPAMESDADLDPYQAPLFYRELASDDEPTHPPGLFGRVGREADGLLRVDFERPAVYFERSTAHVGGAERARLAFAWFHAGPMPGEPVGQGVRVTLGADGLPTAYEVLRDSSGLDVLFAALPLEKAVSEQLGGPLAGRAFAVERALDAAPGVVVAGLAETGQMALGPFLYLGRESTDVLGLHCRCEPSRVDAVRASVEYELVPLAELRALGVEPPAWPAARLEECLRLPAEREG
jgi:hypothetical protein